MVDAAVAPNSKLAMSRALGAAFLNHQVAQLERSVNDNWRERHSPDSWRPADGKRNFPGPKFVKKRTDNDSDEGAHHPEGFKADHDRRRSEDGKIPKVADVIVLDASVLIHGLYHLKQWCREGREEIVIVPLEALYTLDLLKKGTSALAQRARAASRILEAQVGTNPRIRVQRDDAFVEWDRIPFDEQSTAILSASPEWVRRTICCARWELEHAIEELHDNKAPKSSEEDEPKPAVVLENAAERVEAQNAAGQACNHKTPKPRVVLAVLAPSADTQPEAANPAHVSASPVPLPAPQPNRYESRLSSALLAKWAVKARIEVLEVSSAPSNAVHGTTDAPAKSRRSGDGMRRSGEEDRAKRALATRGRRNSRGTAPGIRPPPMSTGTGLVERPQAVMTMMEMVTQPNRVVRVLARGEKLDP